MNGSITIAIIALDNILPTSEKIRSFREESITDKQQYGAKGS
jgi:hypothetical protein